MNPSVLIAGYTTRHVAKSAAQQGCEVYAVDHFCDQDLLWCTKDMMMFNELHELPVALERMLERQKINYIVTTSGAELLDVPNRLGTSPKIAERFVNKEKTQHFFESLDVPVPKILSKGEYPAMMKTLSGSGGWRNAVVQNDDERLRWEEFVKHEPFIMQEVIAGTPASVSCIGTGTDAKAIAANEQILRGAGDCAYAFSGSITPCTHPMTDKMMEIAEKIVAASECVGSVGVDFVLTKTEAYAIEVNPRFQGTVETVEAAIGENLFQMHMDACRGILPDTVPKPKKFCVRKILTAPKPLIINTNMMQNFAGIVADIPRQGAMFKRGDVMFSVFGCGMSRESALASLNKHIIDATRCIKA